MARESEKPFNGPYESSCQMFTRTANLDIRVLEFWRHLAENGLAGRKPEGPPAGLMAPTAKITDQKIQQHLASNGDY